MIKRYWTESEDEQLRNLVKRHGLPNWNTIADSMDGRNRKQCRERWMNNLRPDIKKGHWTDVEDRIIIEKQAELGGNRWSKIAEYLPGRTDEAVKNRWFSAECSRSRKNTSQVSSVNDGSGNASTHHHLNPNAPANLDRRPHAAEYLNVAPKPMLAIPSFPNSTNPHLHFSKKRPNCEIAMSSKKRPSPQTFSSDSGNRVRLDDDDDDDGPDPLPPVSLKPGDGEICPLTPSPEKNTTGKQCREHETYHELEPKARLQSLLEAMTAARAEKMDDDVSDHLHPVSLKPGDGEIFSLSPASENNTIRKQCFELMYQQLLGYAAAEARANHELKLKLDAAMEDNAQLQSALEATTAWAEKMEWMRNMWESQMELSPALQSFFSKKG
uniref:Uncharacterized protein n=1 Tax=Corethron hystrix TaxID=216773 RepID=A0A7S1FZI9_9STRA|mmetsp:Transcript_5529/g.11507  ORF Transcript_5529/g.11507 Transcript_5529/m.11507 type:complete len:383 (+) Transcript_5529:112-1260(+)